MIFCNYTLYKGKVYETYFDKESLKTRFFSDGVEVDGDILLELNNKYNNKPDAEFKFSGTAKLITAIVASNILIASIATGLNTDFHTEPVDNPPSYAVEEQISNEEIYDQLYEAAGDNQDYVEMMYQLINDFSEYLVSENLLNTIETLEIVKENDSVFDNENILGYYQKYNNKIVVSPEVDGYAEESVIYHELIHYLSQSGFSINNDIYGGYIGSGIDEGMTQMLTNEYFMSDNTYALNVCYVQALTELVGKEVMLESYFKNDLDILVDELSNYMSEDDAYSMIKNVDISVTNHQAYVQNRDEEDLINMENAAQAFWDVYEDAYYHKFSINVSDDAVVSACKAGTTFIDENFGLDYIKYVQITKPYFNPRKIEEAEDYSIYFCCDDDDYCLDMNESIRYSTTDNKTK